MEGTPRTHESDVMQFCVIAIETAARKMDISLTELTKRLDEQGLIEGRLFKFYDTLHTQSANYVADDIIGIWQGIEMTGYETYGDANHIINFRADGEYTYYVKKDGKWVPSANVDNEYNVHGDWLATRWRPESGKDFNYEWWDIDYIKDGLMKWSAIREKEDGTRFVTTITWKKVRDMND